LPHGLCCWPVISILSFSTFKLLLKILLVMYAASHCQKSNAHTSLCTTSCTTRRKISGFKTIFLITFQEYTFCLYTVFILLIVQLPGEQGQIQSNNFHLINKSAIMHENRILFYYSGIFKSECWLCNGWLVAMMAAREDKISQTHAAPLGC